MQVTGILKFTCEFRCHKEGNFNWNSQTCNPIFLIRKQPSRCALSEGCLNICSKFTGEHPCRSFISIKLLSNFIEITLWHGCFPVTLLHIFKTSFQCQSYFKKVDKQIYWNHTSAWMFSCKFAVYFQNTFS